MAIANTDYFLKTGTPGSATTLSAPGFTTGNTSINVGSTAGFPTDTAVIFGIDTVSLSTGSQVRNTGTYCVFVGIVTSATSIGSLSLLYGTPQNYAAGATTRVYITVSTQETNRLINGLLVQHKQDGTHGAVTATSVTATTGTFTSLSVTGTNTAAGWSPTGSTPTYAGNNGNKEFLINTSADLTGTLAAGMKYQVTRGTTAPINCMAFTAASSQYATKASPTGITFTTAYTAEAWIYVNSYPGFQAIVGRSDSAATTGGWQLQLTSNGQVRAYYGTTTTFTDFISYQSIPLKRWVHVAAVISSVASKTGAIYINGTAVPTSSPNTAATTLTQASLDLRVGTTAGTPAGNYFDGYMSEIRIWSAAQSQANIQANMAISLTGSETNLVALFQGNGNFNDKTANANNLTATNSAIATQAANPYNNIEYGIITKVTSSQLTVFCGTDCTIPNMTLNSPQYSNVRTPYGFPAAKGKWVVDTVIRAQRTATGAATTWYEMFQLAIPTGDWIRGYEVNVLHTGVSGSHANYVTLSETSAATSEDGRMNSQGAASPVTDIYTTHTRFAPYTTASLKTNYLNTRVGATAANANSLSVPGVTSDADSLVYAECAYI